MLQLNAFLAGTAAMLLLMAPAFAQEDAGSTHDRPAGWEARELPGDAWIFGIKVERDGELALESEYMVPLDADMPYFLFSDHITRGYVEGDRFIPASLIRDFVLVLPDEHREDVLGGEPWLLPVDADGKQQWQGDWPRSMSKAAFERIIAKATHIESHGLHAWIYSNGADNIELEISRVLNHYSIEAMSAPGLPLAGSLLREIEVQSEFEQLAVIALKLQAGGLGWLDSLGNTVVLPDSVTKKQMEARK